MNAMWKQNNPKAKKISHVILSCFASLSQSLHLFSLFISPFKRTKLEDQTIRGIKTKSIEDVSAELGETKNDLKISILSGEAKKILLCKVDVRLPSLPLYPTFYWEEPNLTTLAKNDKTPSTALTSSVLLF